MTRYDLDINEVGIMVLIIDCVAYLVDVSYHPGAACDL
jgi:hypothetical protein